MKKIATQFTLVAAALALASGCSRENDPTTDTVLAPTPPPPAPAPVPSPATVPEPMTDTNLASSTATNDLSPSEETAASTGAPALGQTGQSSSSELPTEPISRSSQYIDFQVLSQQDEQVGQVDAVWEDSSGEPAYIGIKRPNQEQLVLIPAEAVQVNESRKTMRLSLSSQALQSAPTLDPGADLSAEVQQKVNAFSQQHSRPQGPQQEQGSGSDDQAATQDQATIQLRQEQATVRTKSVPAGGVLLRKVVRTETNRAPVTLKREELVIERVPGGGPATNANFAERDIYIPLRREVPVVDKDTVVKETVHVGKEVEEQKANVATPVREEELQIQRQNQGQGAGAPGNVESGRGRGTSSGRAGEEQPQATPEP